MISAAMAKKMRDVTLTHGALLGELFGSPMFPIRPRGYEVSRLA
jgi:hypothetical protein